MTPGRRRRRRRDRRRRRPRRRAGAGLGPAGVDPHPRRRRRRPTWPSHLAAARASPVALAGCVGDDPAGAGLAAELAAAGVRLALRTVPGVPTGTIVSLVEPGGQRSMLADRGANLELRPGDVPLPPRRRPPAPVRLHPAGPAPAGRRAARRSAAAAAAGCTISVDPASTGPLARYGVDRWLADTAAATLLLPNADEARLLTGCADAEDAARALAGAVPGRRGQAWGPTARCGPPGDVLVHRPAHPTTVVDTTGAGDAFAAGLLSVWLARPGGDPAAALDAGLALAAGASSGGPGPR